MLKMKHLLTSSTNKIYCNRISFSIFSLKLNSIHPDISIILLQCCYKLHVHHTYDMHKLKKNSKEVNQKFHQKLLQCMPQRVFCGMPPDCFYLCRYRGGRDCLLFCKRYILFVLYKNL